jgi:uncharacterized protein with PQ loop repeat
MMVVVTSWFAYGIAIHSVPQWAANVPWLVAVSLLSWYALAERRRPPFLGPLVLGALLALLLFLGHLSPSLPGWIATPATLASISPQLVTAWRYGGGRGVSFGSWLISGIASVLFFAYGVTIHAYPMIATNVFQSTMTLTLLIRLRMNPGDMFAPLVRTRSESQRFAADLRRDE